MTQAKQLALKILVSESSPAAMRLEEIAAATSSDIEETRQTLIELQDDELVFLRNGWYSASAVARSTFA